MKVLEPEVWVSFMDASVLLRHVAQEELRGLIRAATRFVWHRAGDGTAQGQLRHELDVQEAARLIGRAAVRGWSGFSQGGTHYPYSAANCDELMQRWAEFSRFVCDALLELQRMHRAEEKELQKRALAHLRARLDYPGLSCMGCMEIEEADGVPPACKTPEGCPLPPLSPEAARVLEMRSLMMELGDLGASDAVLRHYEANAHDLRMLAALGRGIRQMADETDRATGTQDTGGTYHEQKIS